MQNDGAEMDRVKRASQVNRVVSKSDPSPLLRTLLFVPPPLVSERENIQRGLSGRRYDKFQERRKLLVVLDKSLSLLPLGHPRELSANASVSRSQDDYHNTPRYSA